jgi:selenocysteine lyase/cysteine desulfurase
MYKHLFPTAQTHCYLDTAAEGLPPQCVFDALNEYWREKSRGTPGRLQHYEVQREAEIAVASLLGAPKDDVVLLSNTSDALNLLAQGIDWNPGDEVVIGDLEFPSNVVVWLRLRALGVRLHVVASSDGETRLEDWTPHITQRTRVVAVSQVSYKSGTQIPFLKELSAAAHNAGALFVVDATQTLGRVPVHVEGVDYLVASSYKWLLATHGLAVVYCAPALREKLQYATAGWYSIDQVFHPGRFSTYTPKANAGCLQAGMPNFPALYAMNASVRFLLQAGVEQIDARLKPVVERLRAGLAAQGRQLLTPPGAEYASGIVSFADPAPEALMARLAERGVVVWGGDGRIRASLHLYNDDADVGQLLHALRSLRQ